MNSKSCASLWGTLSKVPNSGPHPAFGSHPPALPNVPSWAALLSSGLSPSLCKCLVVPRPTPRSIRTQRWEWGRPVAWQEGTRLPTAHPGSL